MEKNLVSSVLLSLLSVTLEIQSPNYKFWEFFIIYFLKWKVNKNLVQEKNSLMYICTLKYCDRYIIAWLMKYSVTSLIQFSWLRDPPAFQSTDARYRYTRRGNVSAALQKFLSPGENLPEQNALEYLAHRQIKISFQCVRQRRRNQPTGWWDPFQVVQREKWVLGSLHQVGGCRQVSNINIVQYFLN